MAFNVEILKRAIRGLKLLQNDQKDKVNQDYYVGYMSALSNVEGIIAEMEQNDGTLD